MAASCPGRSIREITRPQGVSCLALGGIGHLVFRLRQSVLELVVVAGVDCFADPLVRLGQRRLDTSWSIGERQECGRVADLLASVTLGNTTARANPGTKVAPYLSVALLIRIVGPSLPGDLDQGLFGTAFRNNPATRQARRTWQQRRSQLDRTCAVRTLAGIMLRPDIRAELPDISCPTLVITGSEDAQTPAEHGHEIHDAIPGSRYLELPGVGHCAPIETPNHVTDALTDFLTELPVVTK
jgi:pimeloyl-ACP methyl ester carboxylesterase